MLDHVSIQCRDTSASAAFYDGVLGPLGGERLFDHGEVIGYGTQAPTFWIGPLTVGDVNREVHIAFVAVDQAAVRSFFAAALDLGAEVLQEPRTWPEYHPRYFAAYVRDPDGNNVEAVTHGPTDHLSPKP